MRMAFVLEFLSARRRFIIIVALLAVVVVAAVATLGGGLVSRANESDLVVVEQVKVPDWRGPFLRFNRKITDELEIVSRASPAAGLLQLRIRNPGEGFPQPVESMKRLGGEVRFYGQDALWFIPDKPLPKATPMVLVLSEDISELAECDYKGPHQFEFHTAPLELKSVTQKGFTRDGRITAALAFNDTVHPDDLHAKLSLLDGDGKEVSYELLTTEPSDLFEVQTGSPVEELSVLLGAGLKGAAGPLGLAQTWKGLVPLSFELDFNMATSSTPSAFAKSEVRLHFNNPIDGRRAGRLEDRLFINPPVKFMASTWSGSRYRWGGDAFSGIRLTGSFEPGKKYEITARKGLPGKNGFLLNTSQTRVVRISDRGKGFAFDGASGFLSPKGRRKLQFTTTNLSSVKMLAHQVHANNIVLYLGSSSWRGPDHRPFSRSGEWKEFSIDALPNEVAKTSIDLEQITGSPVAGTWYIEAIQKDRYSPRDEVIVTVTDIALSAKESRDGFLVWATSISAGKPLAGVDISLWTRNNQELLAARTDENGFARFDRPFDDRDGIPFVILGEKDDSLSYLELASHELSYTDFPVEGRAYLSKGYDGFVYSDRGVYRPGESVRIESILRDSWNEEPGEFPVQFEILRPDKKRFKLLRSRVDDSGGAGISFKVPGSALTGEYRVALQLPGDDPGELGTTSFLVEDFVPNRMRLSLAVKDEAEEQDPGRRFHPGESIEVDVSGEYLAGLPARDVPVELAWSVSRGPFNPPGGVAAGYFFGDPAAPPLYMKGVFNGSKLDKDGKASFEVKIPVIESDRPLVFTLEARALDTSGRGVRSTLDLAVDSAPFYIGLRKGFEGNPKPGVPASFKCIALKENGEAASLDELELVLSRIEWSTVVEEDSNNRYRYRSKREVFEVESHKVELGDGRGEIQLSFPGGGHYRVALRDEPSNRLAAVEVYVKTPGWYGWNGGKKLDKPELLEIEVLSKLLYPGEEARALIRSPFPGTLLLTTETDRVLTHRVLEMKTNHMEVTIPVPDIPFGNAYLSASVIRGVDPTQKWRPHRAYGIAPLWIDYSERQLLVSLQAPSRLHPGDSSATLVRVARQDGEPVEAQVSLALVDEGILSWTKHLTPDPWSHFYGRQRAHGVSHRDIYSRFLPEAGVDAKPARPGGGAEFPADDGKRLNPVKAKRFRCAALWLGTFPTGPDGRVLATFDLPQFSGEMRLMAIAHSGSNFGSSEDYIKVRSPLHLELGLPRFLAPGDRFISAVDVFNDTGVRGIAEIDWELSGPLERSAQAVTDLAFASPHTREIGLDIGASRRLFQGFRALGSAGVALARISARLGDKQTEVKVELPVRPAVPLQVNTRTGTITASEPLKLELGDLALPGTARHRICFSPMPSLDLLGSLDYLIRYPHGCLEQTTSSVFPLVYLKDLGGMLDLQYGRGEPSIRNRSAEIDVFIQAGIQRIMSMRSGSGWLSMWPGGSSVWHWGTVYATHFLVEAQKAGIEVPESVLSEILTVLARKVKAGGQWVPQRHYGQSSGLVSAYAVYVLALAGRDDGLEDQISAALEHHDRTQYSSAQTRFLLGAALSALGREQKARTVLGEELPPPSTVRQTAAALSSPPREAALLLSALIDVDPASAQVAALVERLNGYRVGNRWGNTQENAFAILALGKYARQSAAAGSNYTASLRVAGADPFVLEAGESKVIEGDYSGESIQVDLEGDGRLHWFLVEEGVPLNGVVEQVDQGLAVRRRYLDGDGKEIPDGTVRQGDIVQVELRLSASRVLSNLVITDLLPAGLEVENPRLSPQGKLPPRAKGSGKTSGPTQIVTAHMDIRDDRVILYVPSFRGEGVYRYVARAVTMGDFMVPMVAAESMYEPGVYSRGGSGRLIVGDKKGE